MHKLGLHYWQAKPLCENKGLRPSLQSLLNLTQYFFVGIYNIPRKVLSCNTITRGLNQRNEENVIECDVKQNSSKL